MSDIFTVLYLKMFAYTLLGRSSVFKNIKQSLERCPVLAENDLVRYSQTASGRGGSVLHF